MEHFLLKNIGPLIHNHKVEHGNHLVKFYEDQAMLGEAVCNFIVPGITRGDGIIIISTPENQKLFQEKLERRGIDVTKEISQGRVLFLDANVILSKIMMNDRADEVKFKKVIGDLMTEMERKYPSIRAYGEMVNILLQRHNQQAVIALENYWNDLTEDHKFSLLCAYSNDQFHDERNTSMFGKICCTHSHVTSSEGVVAMR